MKSKILFIGAHCDDIELGCGATIHKLRNSYEIHTLTLSPKSLIQANKYLEPLDIAFVQRQAMEILGVPRENVNFGNIRTRGFWEERQLVYHTIELFIVHVKPDFVFCNEADVHQDHETLYKEVKRFRDLNLFTYSHRRVPGNFIVPVTHENLVAKHEALECYNDFYANKPYWGKVHDLASVTAMQSKHRYAESFTVESLSGWKFLDTMIGE